MGAKPHTAAVVGLQPGGGVRREQQPDDNQILEFRKGVESENGHT